MAIMDAKTTLANAQAGVTGASTDAAMLAAYRAVQAAASNLINVLAENGGDAADRASAIEALNNAAAEIGRLEMAIADAAKANAAAIDKLLKGLDDHTLATRTPSSANSPPVTGYTITAAHGKATTVGGTDTTTPANSNTKLKGAMGTTMPGANGWSGTMVTAAQAAVGTTTKKTDTVVVYTNIEAPKSVAFGDAFDLVAGVGGQHLAIGAAGDSNIQASGFNTGHAPVAYGDPDDPNEEHIVPGTYAGAPGEYRCAEGGTNSCLSQGTNDGIQLGGTWVFDPDNGAMAIQADSNYSYFGWWLRENADGTYSPSTFHGHNSGLTSTKPDVPTALTGKATYSGPAVGKYAIAGLPNMGGHFTADASLSVDFEDATAGVAAVSGAVTNFMAGGTAVPWRVDLNTAGTGIAANGNFNGTATWTIDGTASASGGTNNSGLYRGTFQRNNADSETVPMTATGIWEVPYVAANDSEAIGHMIGAFGVTKDD